MKNLNGSFIIHLNGSSIKSLLNKPHQPGQVLLPSDALPSAYGRFSLHNKGQTGCPQGKPHHRGKASSQRTGFLHGKSCSIQHPFPAVLRDETPGTHPMSPTSDAAWPQEMPPNPPSASLSSSRLSLGCPQERGSLLHFY